MNFFKHADFKNNQILQETIVERLYCKTEINAVEVFSQNVCLTNEF